MLIIKSLYVAVSTSLFESKDLQMTLKNEDFSDTLKNDGILRSFDGLFKKMAFWKGIIKISDIKIING